MKILKRDKRNQRIYKTKICQVCGRMKESWQRNVVGNLIDWIDFIRWGLGEKKLKYLKGILS